MVGPKYCLFHDGCYPGPGDFLFFRRDMASPRYFMVKGIKMVSWLSVFSTTLLLRIYIAVLGRLPVE